MTPQQQQQECHLDDLGYYFVKKCIEIIESRGLDDQGLYRVGGVNSRVTRLLQMCLDRRNYNPSTGQVNMPNFSDPVEWETKTITSALKNYLRNLSEPLMTYNLHPAIIEAAKIDDFNIRTNRIRSLIQQLPTANFTLLKTLVAHLKNVARHSQKNLMTVSNLGICFAPTLMRGPEETASSITEIKYSNVVTSTLIEYFDSIFNNVTPQRHNSCQSLNSMPVQYQCPQPMSLPNYDRNYNTGDQYNISLFPYHNLQAYSGTAVTLYACVADAESELSFGPNEIITDVRYSAELGWLIGTLERTGHRGLLPDNYVSFI